MLVHLLILSTAFAAANTGKHGGVGIPDFGEPITNLTVRLGRDVTFECLVVNLGNYKVSWVKADTNTVIANQGHVITRNPRVSVSHSDHSSWYLHIKNVQVKDRGLYECLINTNPTKSQLGFLIILPDLIDEETVEDKMVQECGTDMVSCGSRGIPPARVIRKREYSQEIVVRDQTGVKNKGVEVPEFGEPITNLTVPLGRDATFECIVVNLGNFRVGWVKADTKAIQAIHEHVITHNPRVSVSHSDHSTWYLHIKNVQEEDRGQYMCQINSDPMKSQMGFLDVVIPPDFIPEETSGDTMVPEGGTARVSCRARGIPPPRVMWKREDGQDIVVRDQTGAKNKVLTYQGEVLKLTKISRSEMGTYLCIAGNGIPPTVSKRIHISVHFHPVIQVPNQLVGAPLNTDVTLECYVESSPKSINYWVKDPGELIIPSEHHEMTVRQKSMFEAEMTMTIKNIRREDLGSYICVAKNSLGDVESKIRLYEIPGNDRHAYQYPDVRIPSDDDYGTDVYDIEDPNISDSTKTNRVPDRANKWYSNDGKVMTSNTINGASVAVPTILSIITIFQLNRNL